MATGGVGRGTSALRRFFDKVTLDAGATIEAARDGERFLEAILAHDDKIDLLYRLVSPKARKAWRSQPQNGGFMAQVGRPGASGVLWLCYFIDVFREW
jgi:hypothetical protein